MAIDILDKLRKLVALSESPNEHEASLAAVSACALLRKHEIIFALPRNNPQQGNQDAEIWEDTFGKKRKAAPTPEPVDDAEQPAHADAQDDMRADDEAEHADQDADHTRYFVIKQEYSIRPAKFRGRCARCKKDIRIDATIAWKAGRVLDIGCALHEGVVGSFK